MNAERLEWRRNYWSFIAQRVLLVYGILTNIIILKSSFGKNDKISKSLLYSFIRLFWLWYIMLVSLWMKKVISEQCWYYIFFIAFLKKKLIYFSGIYKLVLVCFLVNPIFYGVVMFCETTHFIQKVKLWKAFIFLIRFLFHLEKSLIWEILIYFNLFKIILILIYL